MSAEEYEDDDYSDEFFQIEDSDLRAGVDELREQVQAEAEVNQINRDIQAFSSRHGLRLSPSDWQSMGELIDAGHDPESAYTELQGADFEDQFIAAIEKVETREGRSLLESEVQKLWEASVRESDPEHLPSEALLDLDNPRDRAALIDERLSPPPDPAETVAPLSEDATSDERAAWAEARAAGAEIEASEDAF